MFREISTKYFNLKFFKIIYYEMICKIVKVLLCQTFSVVVILRVVVFQSLLDNF